MSRVRWNSTTAGLIAGLAFGVATTSASHRLQARQPPTPPPPVATDSQPGHATSNAPIDGLPQLPDEIQIVRFQGPPGMAIDVVEPQPTAVSVTADGLLEGVTHGLAVGVPYRLRLSNLPNDPAAVLYPVIEIVGHLHRPSNVDPSRYPIRVQFNQEDLNEVVESGRLITQIVYLEDPEQALPIRLRKDEVPVVAIGGAEDPLRVAAALGRVMAIVRLGGRTPDLNEPLGMAGLSLEAGPCPFIGLTTTGDRCGVPSCPTLCEPPAAPFKPGLPRDEYLCDGGDHGAPASFAVDGGLSGIDPKDAVVRFRAEGRPRLLPTNTVCIFAPRFATVRQSVGPTQAEHIQTPLANQTVEGQVTTATRQPPMRLTLNQPAEIARMRERASGLINRVGPAGHIEVRVLAGLIDLRAIDDRVQLMQAGSTQAGELPHQDRRTAAAFPLRLAEGVLIQGIVESTGEKVMGWKPQELAGVEVPPNKPGLAVLKQVDIDQAQPGDRLHYTIRYKNVGGVLIRDVSIVDSLLPRLEYVVGSAQGVKGAVFTAADNRAGSVELRWDLPEPLKPGEEGSVTFEAIVR